MQLYQKTYPNQQVPEKNLEIEQDILDNTKGGVLQVYQTDLAKKYGLSRQRISQIVHKLGIHTIVNRTEPNKNRKVKVECPQCHKIREIGRYIARSYFLQTGEGDIDLDKTYIRECLQCKLVENGTKRRYPNEVVSCYFCKKEYIPERHTIARIHRKRAAGIPLRGFICQTCFDSGKRIIHNDR